MNIEGIANNMYKRAIVTKNYFSNNHTTVKASNGND